MSAIPKLFNDAGLTNELPKNGSIYDIFVGPVNGLNGNIGEKVTRVIYLVNVGNQVYQNVTVTKSGDLNNRVTLSLDGTNFSNSLKVGNINAGVSVPIYIKVTVAPGSAAGQGFTVNLTINGESI